MVEYLNVMILNFILEYLNFVLTILALKFRSNNSNLYIKGKYLYGEEIIKCLWGIFIVSFMENCRSREKVISNSCNVV